MRVKGETVTPTNTLLLIQRIGVTRAHRELGVSTTTLHKARKSGVVSRVVEIAASAALSNLGAIAQPTGPMPTPEPDKFGAAEKAMFLVSVSRDKAALFEQFARTLGAEIFKH